MSVDIEVSNICGNGCSICPRDKISRPSGLMDMDTFMQVIELIKGQGRLIMFSGMGDPLSNPKIFEMLTFAYQSGSDVGIVINPRSLNENKIAKLVDSKPSGITVSFPSVRKTVFKKIVQETFFEQAMEMTQRLIGHASGKIGVRVLDVRTLLNHDEKESFTEY